MAVDANQILAQMAQAQQLGQYQKDANRALYGDPQGMMAAQVHAQTVAMATQAMYTAKPWMFPAGAAPITSPAYYFGQAAPMVPASMAGSVPLKPVLSSTAYRQPYGIPGSYINMPNRLGQHVAAAGTGIGALVGSMALWWGGTKALGWGAHALGLGGAEAAGLGTIGLAALPAAAVLGGGLIMGKGIHQAAYWQEALAQLAYQGAFPFMSMDRRVRWASKLPSITRGIANEFYGMSTDEVAGIFKMGAQNHLFHGITDIKELTKAIKELTSNVRKVSDLTGTSLKESMGLMLSLKSLGMGTNELDQLYGLGITSGATTKQGMDTLIRTIGGWQEAGRHAGMTVPQLKNLGMAAARGVGIAGFAGETGAIPSDALFRWTGKTGREGGVAFHQQASAFAQRLLYSKIGRLMLYAGYEPGKETWHVPAGDTIADLERGAVKVRGHYADFLAHKEQIADMMLQHPEEMLSKMYSYLDQAYHGRDENKRRILFKRFYGIDMEQMQDFVQAAMAEKLSGLVQPYYSNWVSQERRMEARLNRILSPKAAGHWLWEHSIGYITRPLERAGAGIWADVTKFAQDKALEAAGMTRQAPLLIGVGDTTMRMLMSGKTPVLPTSSRTGAPIMPNAVPTTPHHWITYSNTPESLGHVGPILERILEGQGPYLYSKGRNLSTVLHAAGSRLRGDTWTGGGFEQVSQMEAAENIVAGSRGNGFSIRPYLNATEVFSSKVSPVFAAKLLREASGIFDVFGPKGKLQTASADKYYNVYKGVDWHMPTSIADAGLEIATWWYQKRLTGYRLNESALPPAARNHLNKLRTLATKGTPAERNAARTMLANIMSTTDPNALIEELSSDKVIVGNITKDNAYNLSQSIEKDIATYNKNIINANKKRPGLGFSTITLDHLTKLITTHGSAKAEDWLKEFTGLSETEREHLVDKVSKLHQYEVYNKYKQLHWRADAAMQSLTKSLGIGPSPLPSKWTNLKDFVAGLEVGWGSTDTREALTKWMEAPEHRTTLPGQIISEFATLHGMGAHEQEMLALQMYGGSHKLMGILSNKHLDAVLRKSIGLFKKDEDLSAVIKEVTGKTVPVDDLDKLRKMYQFAGESMEKKIAEMSKYMAEQADKQLDMKKLNTTLADVGTAVATLNNTIVGHPKLAKVFINRK
jgi:hypothetical protein